MQNSHCPSLQGVPSHYLRENLPDVNKSDEARRLISLSLMHWSNKYLFSVVKGKLTHVQTGCGSHQDLG